MRWYNPTLETFEWREVSHSDEEALSVLDGSPYTPPACGYTESGAVWARALWRRLLERARRPRRRVTDEPSVARSLPFLGGWFDKLKRDSFEVVLPGGLF